MKPVKETLRVMHSKQCITDVTEQRNVLSETLPCWCHNATLLEPDPEYAPNLALGVVHRMGRQPPKRHYPRRKMRRFVLKWCRKNLQPIAADFDLSLEKWLEKCDYTASRKQELVRVFRKFERHLGIDLLQCKVKSFVKNEGYIAAKAARMINSREDYFKVFSGPLFQIISDVVFSHPHFIKKVPMEQRPRAIYDKLYAPGRRVYCTDFTSMEAHFDKENMIDIEVTMYFFMCSKNGIAMWFMRIIVKVLTGPQQIRFKLIIVMVVATRMSGEMNTSLGNGFANLMIFLFICDQCGCVCIWIFVEGDDGISAIHVQEHGHEPTAEDFDNLGWTIKLEVHETLNTASFCGMVFDPTDLIVVTDPMKVLASFGKCPKRYVGCSYKVKLQLLRAKGFSMAHQYNGSPMIAALGRRLVAITDGVRIRKSIVDSVDMFKRQHLREAVKGLPVEIPVPPSTRELVHSLYGVTPQDQIAFEDQISNLELDMSFGVQLPFPQVWREAYDKYTARAGDIWIAPCPVSEQQKQLDLLATFGDATRTFLDSYLRA